MSTPDRQDRLDTLTAIAAALNAQVDATGLLRCAHWVTTGRDLRPEPDVALPADPAPQRWVPPAETFTPASRPGEVFDYSGGEP